MPMQNMGMWSSTGWLGITVAHERQTQAFPSPSGDRTVNLLVQPLHAPQSIHVPMHQHVSPELCSMQDCFFRPAHGTLLDTNSVSLLHTMMLTQFSLESVDAGSDLLALGIMYSLLESQLITKALSLSQSVSGTFQSGRSIGRGLVVAIFTFTMLSRLRRSITFCMSLGCMLRPTTGRLRLSENKSVVYLCLPTPAQSVP